MSATIAHKLPAIVVAGDRALRAARLPGSVEASARAALSRRGHLFGDAPRWARLFLTWAAALAPASVDTLTPAAVACKFMAAGYDLLDQTHDRACARPEMAEMVLEETLPAGVSLLLLAQELLAGVDVAAARRVGAGRAFARAGRRAFAGQVADHALRARPDADHAAALDVLRRRSGSLVAAPCQCAALLVGAHWRAVALAGRFGHALGCAAQLEDDLADRAEDAGTGRITLPLLLARRHAADPALVEAAVWVLHRRFLTQAADAIERLPRQHAFSEVLWTLLPADPRTR